ncbi:hypothetical protein R8510_05277 [Ralstonia chuxiongensis]|nr:hypothetical protein R8510_05277 [Ralstonia chuxiongensis]
MHLRQRFGQGIVDAPVGACNRLGAGALGDIEYRQNNSTQSVLASIRIALWATSIGVNNSFVAITIPALPPHTETRSGEFRAYI